MHKVVELYLEIANIKVCVMRIQNGRYGISTGNTKFCFKGTPQRISGVCIKNYQDALNIWEKLRYAKYLDAHQNSYYDKSIRADNYSFLDKLTSYSDKSSFVEKFCEFTGFPHLSTISNKIDSTFKACISNISRKLNSQDRTSGYDIIDWGYDPTCSLGLRKAFPGSDLDKGYVIIKGSYSGSYNIDKDMVDNFKGELWEDLDQRIVSLNHPDTFPSVYTKNQVKDTLSRLDKKAKEMGTELKNKVEFTIIDSFLTLPFSTNIIDQLAKYYDKKGYTTDPYIAGKFNRKLAKKLKYSSDREEAKNFAFFIEIVRANLERNSYGKNDSLFSTIRDSLFARNSNVTQVGAWQNRINGGYMKSKLRNRMKLESDFYSMSTDTKYDLVKDVIKYGTDDQSSRFSQYFKNDDDIANRYGRLLDSLK